MIKDAEDFAEEDKKVAERAVAKVRLEIRGFLIFTQSTEGILKEHIDSICSLDCKLSFISKYSIRIRSRN